MMYSRRGFSAALAAFVAPRALAMRRRLREESGYLPVPGGTVWWRRVGDGRKPPLLLLHGGPGAGSAYLEPMAGLADDRAVIFYDQLGCGRSDAPENDSLYSIPRSVAELDAVRHALNLDDIVLFGNSWGTMLAIEYLLDRGTHGVHKLILSGALSSVPQAVAGMQRLLNEMPEGIGRRIHQLEAENRADSPEYQRLSEVFYRLHVCRRDPWPPEMKKTIDILSKSPAYRVMNGPNEFTIVGNIKTWDRSKDVGAISVPTLLTTGQFDEVTLDCHQTIQKAIAGSRLVVMDGCSHITMLEQPKHYNRIVREFIS